MVRRHVVVLFSVLMCVGTAGAPMALPPLDAAPEDLQPRIEWGEDWSESLKANVERWSTELKDEANEDVRNRRLSLRKLALLKAALEKFGGDEETALSLRFDIAEQYGHLNAEAHRVAALHAIIEANPGDLASAKKALDDVLWLAWHRPDELPRSAHWVAYAAERLIGMAQGGYLAGNDPSVLGAYLALAELRRNQHRFAEAGHALDQVEARGGRTAQWLMESAKLAMAMQLETVARERLDALQSWAADSDSVARSLYYLDRDLGGVETPGPLPTVTPNPALETRWEMIRKQAGPGSAPAVAALLDDPETVAAVTPVGGARYRSLWSAVVDWVGERSQAAEVEAQRHAEAAAAAASAAGDAELLLAAARRFPWSGPIHEAMLAAGERALWRGRPGLAYRWFEDVSRRGLSGDLRERAETGRWLALSQSGERHALEAALSGVSGERQYAWLGGTISGSELRDQLLLAADTSREAHEPSLERVRTLALPAAATWAPMPGGANRGQRLAALDAAPRPVMAPDGWSYVSGPNYIAGYAPGSDQPTWMRVQPVLGGLPDEEVDPLISPDTQWATVADGVVMARGVPRGQNAAPTALVAYDAHGGAVRWSTRDDPSWHGLVPVSDPTIAGGVAYVVAVDEGLLTTPYVVAFDPPTGETIWKRALASQSLTLPMYRQQLDVTTYGNRPTVVRGAVYVSTNLGMTARLDARDGTVDWLYLYPRTHVNRDGVPHLKRHGAPPIVADGHVLLLPRDHQGLFALDAATGAPAWHRNAAPSLGAAGSVSVPDGKAVLVSEEYLVAAIDPATGQTLWRMVFEQPLRGRPQLIGESLYLLTGDDLVRLEAATGAQRDRRAWVDPYPAAFGVAAPLGGRSAILGVSLQAEGSVQPQGHDVTVTGDLAHLRRERPVVVGEAAGVSVIRSGGMIEAIEHDADVAIPWRRRVSGGDALLELLPDRLVIADGAAVEVVGLDDGTTMWRRSFDSRITKLAVSEAGVAAASIGSVTLLDANTGEIKWRQMLLVDAHELNPEAMSFHDGLLHIVAPHRSDKYTPCRVTIDVDSGQVMAQGRLLAVDGDHFRMWYIDVTRNRAWLIQRSKEDQLLMTFLGSDGLGPRSSVTLKGLSSRRWPQSEIGPEATWMRLRQRNGSRFESWLIPLKQPDDVVKVDTWWVPLDGGLAMVLDKKAVQVYRPGEKPLTLSVPQEPGEANPIAAAAGPRGERVAVASQVERRPEHSIRPMHLRIDVFDTRSAAHLASRVLPGVPVFEEDDPYTGPTAMKMAWHGDVLLVTGPHGVDVLPVPESLSTDPETPTIPHHAGPMVIDGRFDDWEGALTLPLAGPNGAGELRLMHDNERLYVGVSHPQRSPSPHVGMGLSAGGSWLEIGTGVHSRDKRRFGVGLGEVGRATWIPFGEESIPRDARRAVHYDADAGELHYELSIPLDEVTNPTGDTWRGMGLSVTAWRDGEAGSTPIRYTWGRGLESPRYHEDWLRLVNFERREKP